MSNRENAGLADVITLVDKNSAEAAELGGLRREVPANDLVNDVLERLVIDESDPYLIASVEGYILHANDAYRAMALASAGSLAVPPLAGGKGNLTIDVAAVIDEVKSLKGSVQYSERYVIEGEERLFATKYLPVANGVGDIVAVVASYRETTSETRQVHKVNEAQRRFKDFARATSDWFWEADRNLRIKGVSDRFTAITGQPGALVIGKKLQDLGAFGPNHLGKESADKALEKRVAFRDQLVEIDGSGDEPIKFHLSGVPIFDSASGDFEGFRGAGMDVTEKYRQEAEAREIRKDLEATLDQLKARNRELDRATEEARTALKAKNEFLATMSHELRTPLNAIIGFAEAMQAQMFGDLNERYIECARDILNSARHLLGLIEDVLDVAVLESGEMSLSIEDVLLRDILKQAASVSRARSQIEGAEVTGLEVSASHRVRADQRRAVQIFANLLTNALKFTPPSGKIGLHVSDLEGGNVAVTVWDTGVGIEEEHHERVFEKFQQITDSIYSRETAGVGLGLHISRELARRMGGDILVDSQLGKGSRFTVILPSANG